MTVQEKALHAKLNLLLNGCGNVEDGLIKINRADLNKKILESPPVNIKTIPLSLPDLVTLAYMYYN